MDIVTTVLLVFQAFLIGLSLGVRKGRRLAKEGKEHLDTSRQLLDEARELGKQTKARYDAVTEVIRLSEEQWRSPSLTKKKEMGNN